MKTAIHSTNQKPFTVERYVKEFGPKLDKLSRERDRPKMVCAACGLSMHTVAESGPLRDATWAHYPSENAPWCPLKHKYGGKYDILEPKEPNEAAGKELRTSFFANWRLHWAHVREIVPMCDIFTFISFIKYADTKRFWEQAGLEEWFIPYVFLATCDFPPPKSSKGAAVRPYWVRCRFDARVRSPEDLWIRTDGDWGYVRAHYTAPARGAEPGPNHLIDASPVVPDKLFLTRLKTGGSPFQVEKMRAAFPSEVA